jgi:hypothetical protein
MDMNHHAVAVDIRDFQMQSFLQSEPASIDRGQKGPVVTGSHLGQQPVDFIPGEHGRQMFFPLSPQILEGAPVASQHLGEEKPQAAVADAHGARRPAIDVATMQEVLLQLILINEVGRSVEKLGQHAQRPQVTFLGPFGIAGELHSLGRSFVPVGHHGDSPCQSNGKNSDSKRSRRPAGAEGLMTERQRSEGSGADEDVHAGDARAHCREAAYLNNRMQLTWLIGAPSRSVSVHRRACGRRGLGSPATQLMRAVGCSAR